MTTSLLTPASWVIVERETGKAVLETYSKAVADAVNLERYAVFPVLEYLGNLNRSIRNG